MQTDSTFRTLLILVLVAFTLTRVYGRLLSGGTRQADAPRESRPQRLLLIVGFLLMLSVTLIYLFRPQWLMWASVEFPAWVRWLGALLGVLAVALLFWVHRALGRNFSSTLRLGEQHTLVIDGPYRWVRHPMYIGFILLSLAIFLLSANVAVGVAWMGVMALIASLRVRAEEAMLVERFGDKYRTYAERIGRFLPKIRFNG